MKKWPGKHHSGIPMTCKKCGLRAEWTWTKMDGQTNISYNTQAAPATVREIRIDGVLKKVRGHWRDDPQSQSWIEHQECPPPTGWVSGKRKRKVKRKVKKHEK